jgi:hypothetical protein
MVARMNKVASSPPRKVLQAFGVGGEVEKLKGGQGHVFASDHVVLKPVADEAEAIWIAESLKALLLAGPSIHQALPCG